MNKKRPLARLVLSHILYSIPVCFSLLLAFVFNVMAWMGSIGFIKKYLHDYAFVGAILVMLFPSFVLGISIHYLIKLFIAIKGAINTEQTKKV